MTEMNMMEMVAQVPLAQSNLPGNVVMMTVTIPHQMSVYQFVEMVELTQVNIEMMAIRSAMMADQKNEFMNLDLSVLVDLQLHQLLV